MATDDRNIGGFTIDETLVVRTWDPWMARATRIPGGSARGRALSAVLPDLEARGLLAAIRDVIREGTVRVLAPAFHRYLFACPPTVPSRHFVEMQQRVTIGPLREGARIVGAMITVEDVTQRLDRERAIAEGGIEPEAVPSEALRTALRGEDWQVRRQATDRMAQAGGREMVASLLAALRDEHRNFSVVSSALQLLSQIELDVINPLIEFLAGGDADLRIQAALGLGEQRDPRAIPALVAALDDPDANVRFHAIEGLGKLRASDAVDRLLEIAHSGDFFLAFAALDSLAGIGDARIAPLLAPLLNDEMLRNAVVDTLGNVGNESTVGPLLALLDGERSPVEPVARALVSLHRRAIDRYGDGESISDGTRQRISPRGVATLVAAAPRAKGDGLRAIAIVLGWLEGADVERALARLLGDDAVRRDVVEALVRFGPRVTDLLVQQLSAESVEARQAAIIALGRIGDRRATAALLDMLGRDRETVLTTAGALAKIGDPIAYDRLFTMIADPDTAVRQAVIAALNSIGHPDMSARVFALLEDPDWRTRESAVKIAGYFGYPNCLERLFARCGDEQEEVRRAALDHLPFLDDPRVIPTLEHAVRHDAPRARAAAAHALGRVEDVHVVSTLMETLHDPDPWVRYFAARALGHHRAAQSVNALIELLRNDPAMHVRLAAVEALGAIGTAEAAALLAPLSEGEDDVAIAAVRALGAMAHQDAWPPLRNAVQSGNPRRQLEAIRAVATCGGQGAPALLEWVAAASDDETIAREAILALGQLAAGTGARADAAVRALVELTADPGRREASVAALGSLPPDLSDQIATGLSDPRREVREAVVDALGRLRHVRASAWLRRALDDSAPEVRKAAIGALLHLGSRGVETRLATLARTDPDASVRSAARGALGASGTAAPPTEPGATPRRRATDKGTTNE